MASRYKHLIAASAAAFLLPAAASAATLMNFESGCTDNELLSSPTVLRDSTGAASNVTLSSINGSMSVAATGSDATAGFINDTLGLNDTENAGALGALGGYFLRTTNALSGPAINPVFSLSFAVGASAVSGEIWDIDGNRNQDSEGWDVVAHLAGGGTSTISSPILSNNRLTGGGPTLDGLPWSFSFSGVGTIKSLDFVFTGSKQTGIGAAVDNLKVSAVPLPAGGLLLLSGLGVAAVLRRRKK